jgi:hypothetical protein
LYTLRIDILNKLGNELVVYGEGWNQVGYKIKRVIGTVLKTRLRFLGQLQKIAKYLGCEVENYQGRVESKVNALRKHRFALIVENSKDYISEKLIDAIICGSVPIYVGPDLREFGYPKDICVKCNADVDSVVDCVKRIQEDYDEQERILQKGREFLKSNSYQTKVNSFALRALARKIRSDVIAKC